MGYPAALFDLDGTLLDSLGDIAACSNDALAQHGFPTHDLEAYRLMVGDGAGTLVARSLGEAANPTTVQAVLDSFRTLYAARWQEQACLYEGIADMLDGLVDRGVILMVLSNKPDSFTQNMVAHYFARWPFTWVRGAREGVPLKPAPQAAWEAAAFAKHPPQQILYIGDTSTDMQTAKTAGMPAVGVTWGFRDREELAATGADYLIDHPSELLPLVEK